MKLHRLFLELNSANLQQLCWREGGREGEGRGGEVHALYNFCIMPLPKFTPIKLFQTFIYFLAGISCRHIQQIALANNKDLQDGVYTINPTGNNPMLAYCDMSRDGGGWTLLVTSHTNSWTSQNVLLRNKDTPQLDNDYSILSHADSIKNNINVKGTSFEYRLEAEELGKFL